MKLEWEILQMGHFLISYLTLFRPVTAAYLKRIPKPVATADVIFN